MDIEQVLLAAAAGFVGLGALGILGVIAFGLFLALVIRALWPRKMYDFRANPVDNIVENIRYERASRKYERKEKECDARGGHKWYTDNNDFWLTSERCSHCQTGKPDSLRINDFGEHILSLPKEKRKEEIEERKGQFKSKWGI